jgi:hypothetical protein
MIVSRVCSKRGGGKREGCLPDPESAERDIHLSGADPLLLADEFSGEVCGAVGVKAGTPCVLDDELPLEDAKDGMGGRRGGGGGGSGRSR